MHWRRFWPHTGRHTDAHRHSLRRRLTMAFVLVELLTLMVAFVVITAFDAVHRPWRLHVLLPTLLVAGAAGAFTAGRITHRLTRLGAAVERLDMRDLSLRVPVEGDDEVAALARGFNRMVDRLEAEERVRRELFADIAHELRHPLAVLQGRLEMLQDGVAPLTGEQVLYLQDMVLSLNRLVGDLRDLSLAEVGRLSLTLAPLDLSAMIEDLRENMEPVAADKSIALVAEVAPDLPRVQGDADRLRQVLVNLLANALHYTPHGGRVEVQVWPEGSQVWVTVSDTGPGIAPEDLPHIFDRFYRADNARARSTGGSGLGLAIVRSLVMLHGGTVRADSRPGEGSRFTISLPLP